MSRLKELIKDLGDTWDLTSEQLSHIEENMALFALDCCISPKCRQDAENIVQEIEEYTY